MKKVFLAFVLFFAFLLVYLTYPEESLPKDVNITKIVVVKKDNKLQLWENDNVVKTYSISLGQSPEGHKVQQGDSRTPEGHYVINDKNPNSGYHLNLGISYPNKSDIQKARSMGVNPGGDIKIHGIRNGIGFLGKLQRLVNWTDGCIAVTDSEIEEIYTAVSIGTPIEIQP